MLLVLAIVFVDDDVAINVYLLDSNVYTELHIHRAVGLGREKSGRMAACGCNPLQAAYYGYAQRSANIEACFIFSSSDSAFSLPNLNKLAYLPV